MKSSCSTGHFVGVSGPRQTFLVSVADKHRGGNEVLAIEWATPLSVKPPLFGIVISRNKHTHDVIRAARAFTVNVPSTDNLKEVWWTGSHTGRQYGDKIAASGLTSKPGSTNQNTVSIVEARASFECRVVDEIPLGDHTLFVGEVTSVEASEDLFDTARGMWYPDKLKTIYRVAHDVFVGSSNSVLSVE